MADDKKAENEIELIKKLPPQERLKKLKELEEKKKKEAEEAKKVMEKIVNESLKEIKLDEMLREMEVPKEKDVDIDKLFVEEEEKKIKALQENRDYMKGMNLSRQEVTEIQQWYTNQAQPDRQDFLETYERVASSYDSLKKEMARKDYTPGMQAAMDEVLDSRRLLRSLGYKHRWLGGQMHVEKE